MYLTTTYPTICLSAVNVSVNPSVHLAATTLTLTLTLTLTTATTHQDNTRRHFRDG